MRIKKYLLTTFLVILLCISIVFMVACQKIITVTLDYGYDNKIETFELSKGEKIQKRTPQRDGYVFEGWFWNDELFTRFDNPPSTNFTLVAKWSESFTVTLEVNGQQHSFVAVANATMQELITSNNINLSKSNVDNSNIYDIEFFTLDNNEPIHYDITQKISANTQVFSRHYNKGCSFELTQDNSAYILTEINDSLRLLNENVVLPYFYNNKSIVGIGDEAFMKKVAGNYFGSDATNIELPYYTESIGKFAFFNNNKISQWFIPKNVISVQEFAFSRQDEPDAELTKVEFDIDSKLTTFGNNMFNNQINLKDIINIPKQLTTIENGVFSSCYSLNNIVLPNTLTSIGTNGFYMCKSLTNITIPNGVTVLQDFVFESCTKLESVVIPNSVTTINKSTFQNCSNLTSISLPNNLEYIGASAFMNCYKLTNITLPNTLTTIGTSAFENCYKLSNITIPFEVVSIGNRAFFDCKITENQTTTYLTIYDNKLPQSTRTYGNNWNGYAKQNNVIQELPTITNYIDFLNKIDSADVGLQYSIGYGESYNESSYPVLPTKDGFIFGGFYEKGDDTRTLLINANCNILYPSSDTDFMELYNKLNGNITLQALWQEIQ